MTSPSDTFVRSYTRPEVVRDLLAGNAVPLEAPGYLDTCSVACPDCGQLVKTVRGYPDAPLFYYGRAFAYPHRCGVEPPWESDAKSQRLERVNRELALIAEQTLAERIEVQYGAK
ncbi:MAG: hypothetical protein OEV88_17095 [Gammaproteobacteria bacterium]|nr:hypothetical protein [Gammaproteobacteria bacterium]